MVWIRRAVRGECNEGGAGFSMAVSFTRKRLGCCGDGRRRVWLGGMDSCWMRVFQGSTFFHGSTSSMYVSAAFEEAVTVEVGGW